jgi:uncharacterized protein (DUF697 family)
MSTLIDVENVTTASAPEVTTRLTQAQSLVNKRALWAAGAGLIPVPILDVAGIFAVQVNLINELSKLYDIPFSKHKVKNLIAPLIGSVGAGYATAPGVTSLFKFMVGPGTIAGILATSTIGSAATYAVGRVFVQHFEAGGNLLDFKPELVKNFFEQQFQEGLKKAEKAKAEAKPVAEPAKAGAGK